MQAFLSLSLALYLVFYAFEGPIRYGLHLAHADALIFLRDILLIIPLFGLLVQQFFTRSVHPAFTLFFLVILLHGTVMILNIGSYQAVAYGAKILLTVLVGALAAASLFRPSRGMLLLMATLWVVSWVGIVLDKYYIELPWAGMETTIGDVRVEISRDWQIKGANKRAAGFLRSSIYAATFMPLVALTLIFNLRGNFLRVMVALLSIPALVWTTQKGAILAYILTLGLLALWPRRPIPFLRAGLLTMLLLCVALPVILPGYTMPSAAGVFSFSSFYQRIEEMWPQAWVWIHAHEAFPFGVGLGGISGAQRLYALNDVNAADNVFVLMYAYFGVMSLLYLSAVAIIAMRTENNAPKASAQAMATLLFLFGYGCVISLLEDQMASLFLGASLGWLCQEIANRSQTDSLHKRLC